MSKQQEKRIILYHYFDTGETDFERLVAVTGLCITSIRNHFTIWQSGGSHERKRGSGTTGKLKENQVESLLQYVYSHPQLSSRQFASWATNEFNFQAWCACILNTLMKNGLKNWKLRKLPPLTEQHRMTRVAWCIFYHNMDWSKVYFTDETYFVLVRAKNRYWSIEQPTIATPLQSPKLGVWGGISSRRSTELHFFTKTIDCTTRIYWMKFSPKKQTHFTRMAGFSSRTMHGHMSRHQLNHSSRIDQLMRWIDQL